MDSANNFVLERARNFISSYLFAIVLILIPFSFPYPSFKIFNFLTILLVLFWLIKKDLRERIRQVIKNRFVLLFCSSYLIFAVCLLYSENLARGGFLLEKRLSIFIFPIIMASETISDLLLKKILLSFVLSCLIASIISLLSVDFSQVVEYYWIGVDLFRESFKRVLDLDPPYFGLYITFSIIVTGFYLFRDWRRLGIWWKLTGSIILIYLVVVDILLSARMSLIILLLLCGVLYIYFLVRNKKFRIPGTVAIVIIGLSLAYTFKEYDIINKRFQELTNTEWAPPVGAYHNSTNLRIGILYCCADLLDDNWLLGVGSGDVQDNLNVCYKTKGYSDVMYIDEYNTHNEYLNVWLNTGLAGLLLFLLSLFIPLKIAFQWNYFLYLAFLIVIILSCTTESLFERQKGVIFYAFFNSLLAFNSIGVNNTKKLVTV